MTRKEIQQLIAKYDDGMTNGAEEQALRLWFRSTPEEDIPQEWRAYRMVFAFIDSKILATGRFEKASACKTAATAAPHETVGAGMVPVATPSVQRKRRFSLTLLARVGAIAACIVAAVVFVLPKASATDGYAVLDGRKVTNGNVVKAEAEAALQMVSYAEDDAFGAFGGI